MFYAHIVLAKKGPLARIWLAAHWDKKLTKAHVFETNIEQSVEGIMQPKVKLALRTSGHLLLGVVRIYSRKAKYLLADCNEAFVKIKMAFRPGMVDLPEEHREAAVNAITLPEVFHDFDTALPELNDVDIEEQFSINQSRADEITMREDYGTLPMSMHDDGFGDMAFDTETPDLGRAIIDPNLEESLFAEDIHSSDFTKGPIPGTSRSILDIEPGHHLGEEGFGDDFGQPAAGLFEGDLFADAPLPQSTLPPGAMTSRTDSDDDMDHFDVGAPSPNPSTDNDSRPPTPMQIDQHAAHTPAHDRPVSTLPHTSPLHAEALHPEDEAIPQGDNLPDQTTLLNNEEESFALAPVDASALKGLTKAKRKRKLVVDEVKNISGEEMKSQLASTSDIVTTLDLAPPTKRLMYWKETGGVEKLFALPARDIPARCLFKNYQRNLTSRPFGIEDFSVLGPAEVLALEQHRIEEAESPVPKKQSRKRKFQDQIEVQQQQSLPEPDLARDLSSVPAAHDSIAPLAVEDSINASDCLMPPPPSGMQSSHNPVMFASGNLSDLHMSGVLPMPGNISIPTPLDDVSVMSIPMTPGNVSMTPSHHSDNLEQMLPTGFDGGMTPHHSIENIISIPNLPADQVSSILNDDYTNMGYDGHHADSHDIGNDWNDDYEFPQSVGQVGDEQMEDETDEAFEERVLNKRAAQMFVTVRARMLKTENLYLSDMTFRNTKKQAAQKFYSLLVLKKFRALEIKQDEPYGDILVTRGPMFDNPTL